MVEKVQLRREWCIPLIKGHHSPGVLFKRGITAKEFEVIGRAVGITAKTRGCYENHLAGLVDQGMLIKSDLNREGCAVFTIPNRTYVRTIKAMKVLPAKKVQPPKPHPVNEPQSTDKLIEIAFARVRSGFLQMTGGLEQLFRIALS